MSRGKQALSQSVAKIAAEQDRWAAFLREGYSLPDETVETVVERIATQVGWSATRAMQALIDHLASHGETLAGARQLYAEHKQREAERARLEEP